MWGRTGKILGWGNFRYQCLTQVRRFCYTPPPCISYADVHNYYSPYACCSLDKGVACAQQIQLPTHMCTGHMC